MTTAIASPTDSPDVLTYWQWQGHAIHYVHAPSAVPSAHPPLLLVHGFGASTDHWRKNIADLQQDFDVWAIDLLGFGRSAKPDIEYAADLWRDQLHDFIESVIGRPAVLAGNSLGGYASLCLGAERPQSAQGVILINSAGPFSDSLQAPSPKGIKAMGRSLIRRVLLGPVPSYLLFQYTRRRSVIRKTLKKVYVNHDAVTDQLIEDIYRPSCDPGAAKVFASVFKAKQGQPVDHLLQQLSRPLLMLWGEGDPWMNTRDRGAKFRHYYPSLTEQYFAAGHCPHDESPEEIDAAIRHWVTNHIAIAPAP